MKTWPANLEQIQRWMQSVIMHPSGVDEAISSREAQQHIALGAEDLESVIRRSSALTSRQRLEIYVDAYYERLLECLREEFSVVCQTLGQDLFDALAFGYLQQYPSRSYTLAMLGAKFPAYLVESPLHAHEIPEGAPDSWPQFVIELAAFERLQHEVFDAPGLEQSMPLDAHALDHIPAEEWAAVQFIAPACLRLARYDHPVHDYWAACKAGQRVGPPNPRATWLAIHRRDYALERHELTAMEYELLRQVIECRTPLAEAIMSLVRDFDASPDQLEDELRSWFTVWTSAGFFASATARQDGQ